MDLARGKLDLSSCLLAPEESTELLALSLVILPGPNRTRSPSNVHTSNLDAKPS